MHPDRQPLKFGLPLHASAHVDVQLLEFCLPPLTLYPGAISTPAGRRQSDAHATAHLVVSPGPLHSAAHPDRHLPVFSRDSNLESYGMNAVFAGTNGSATDPAG
jgi:hypothetical protein